MSFSEKNHNDIHNTLPNTARIRCIGLLQYCLYEKSNEAEVQSNLELELECQNDLEEVEQKFMTNEDYIL